MEELLTFMWANKPFDSTRPDTYFEKVKMLNKEVRMIIINDLLLETIWSLTPKYKAVSMPIVNKISFFDTIVFRHC